MSNTQILDEPVSATDDNDLSKSKSDIKREMADNEPAETKKEPKPVSEKSNPSINFAVVQMPFVAGDIVGNTKKIRAAALDAKSKGADVVIFSELAFLGYPPADLLMRPSLPERMKQAMKSLMDIPELVMIVGYPHITEKGVFNAAAVIYNGVEQGCYHKQCLATDSSCAEGQFFDKGDSQLLFDYKGVTIGLLIGEDIWHNQPMENLKKSGAELVISIHASPFEVAKQQKRKERLTSQAKKYNLPIVYANTVGGQDELVFDGGSMAVNADGVVACEASRFLSQLLPLKFDVTNKQFYEQAKPAMTLSEESEMYQALVVGLRDYVHRSGFGGVIVGLSGGIDSALTLCIAVDALGADKVYAVMMPYQYTSPMSLEDAEAQAKRLNVSYTVCSIHDAVSGLKSTLAPLLNNDGAVGITEENLQARARGTILMALSNKFGHMVVNTSNKSEVAVGYGTLYGDMVGGFGALKDVYKTDVYRLANYRNRLEDTPVIPERVILRAPSAELRPDQKDQDSLPEYEVLDAILRLYIEEERSFDDIVNAGFDETMVIKVLQMVNKNEYKRRQAPIGSKISTRAFSERRYPLVNGWQVKF